MHDECKCKFQMFSYVKRILNNHLQSCTNEIVFPKLSKFNSPICMANLYLVIFTIFHHEAFENRLLHADCDNAMEKNGKHNWINVNFSTSHWNRDGWNFFLLQNSQTAFNLTKAQIKWPKYRLLIKNVQIFQQLIQFHFDCICIWLRFITCYGYLSRLACITLAALNELEEEKNRSKMLMMRCSVHVVDLASIGIMRIWVEKENENSCTHANLMRSKMKTHQWWVAKSWSVSFLSFLLCFSDDYFSLCISPPYSRW